MFIRYLYLNYSNLETYPFPELNDFERTIDSYRVSPIDTKYGELGGNQSPLGPPIEPEQPTPDGIGRYRRFKCGNIYWSPAYGAHEVHGAILREYEKQGETKSMLGFPITDQAALVGVSGGVISNFQGGNIIYDPSKGISVSYNIRRLNPRK